MDGQQLVVRVRATLDGRDRPGCMRSIPNLELAISTQCIANGGCLIKIDKIGIILRTATSRSLSESHRSWLRHSHREWEVHWNWPYNTRTRSGTKGRTCQKERPAMESDTRKLFKVVPAELNDTTMCNHDPLINNFESLQHR